MLAQRRRQWPDIFSQLGQCIWVVVFFLCIQNAGLLLGHRQTRRLIEATLVGCPVIAVDAGVQEGCVRSGLEWC